jgi:hypothetical protein
MMRGYRFRTAIVLLTLATVLVAANAAFACPTCKDAVAANDPEHEGMVKGYFYSILFMMGMPYLVLSCFGIYMYREVKKARARDAAKKQQSPDVKKPLAPAMAAIPSPSVVDSPPVETRELIEV